MKNSTQINTISQIKKTKAILRNDADDISLNTILSSDACQTIFSECREFRDRIYTPIKTIFMFVKQVLHPDKSCRNAVAGTVAEQICSDEQAASTNTGPYCKARKRLPEKALHDLVVETGRLASSTASKVWSWHGRAVKLVDGTTITMADTLANQDAFPQHGNQKKGVGFPITRLVAIMSLGVGVVMDYAMAAHKGKGTGEHALLRKLIDCINPEDIVLGGLLLSQFFLIADLKHRGADGIFHGHAHRHYDFRRGISLGEKEHIVKWEKPTKPTWMDQETYDKYPKKIALREFKIHGKVYVTTLLDSKSTIKKRSRHCTNCVGR